MTVKRGFNRLYIVLAVVWAFYWLVVYPFHQRMANDEDYRAWQEICRTSPGPLGVDHCLQTMKEGYEGHRTYNGKFWWILLAFVAISTPAVYGLCRGFAALGMWVWRGFQRQ